MDGVSDNEDGWFDNDGSAAVAGEIVAAPKNNARKALIWGAVIALVAIGGAALGAFEGQAAVVEPAEPAGPTRAEQVALDAARDGNKTSPLRRGLLARLDTLIEARGDAKANEPDGAKVDVEAKTIVAAAAVAEPVVPPQPVVAAQPVAAVPIEIPTTYVDSQPVVVTPVTAAVVPTTQPVTSTVTPAPAPTRAVRRTRRVARAAPTPAPAAKPVTIPTPKPAATAAVAPAPAPTKTDIASASSLVSAAYKHLKGGRAKKAVATYKEALALSPRNTKARLGLGRALYETGQLASAMKAFEAVLARSSSNREGLMWAGATAQQLGQRSKARKFYQRYLDKHPTSRRAKEVRRILKQL